MKVGDSIWYCKKNGKDYDKPIEVVTQFGYFTVMGKSGYNDIIQFGEKINSYLTVIAQPYNLWKDTFSNGDLFYCNGVKPLDTEKWYGEQSNYIIDDVDYGNNRIKLTLKKR